MERTLNKIFIISEHTNTAVTVKERKIQKSTLRLLNVNDKQKKPDNNYKKHIGIIQLKLLLK